MDPKAMKRKAVAYKIVYSFLIAFAIGIILGFGAPSAQGSPITVEGFFSALWQGTLVGGIVGCVLPVPKILGFYFKHNGGDTAFTRKLITDIVLATIFTIVIGFYFTAVNTGFDTYMTASGPVTFMSRMMNGFMLIWLYIFLGAYLTGPICTTLATKITGFDPAAAAAATAADEAEAADDSAAAEKSDSE